MSNLFWGLIFLACVSLLSGWVYVVAHQDQGSPPPYGCNPGQARTLKECP